MWSLKLFSPQRLRAIAGALFQFYLKRKTEFWIVATAAVAQAAYLCIVPLVDTPDSTTYLENSLFFAGLSEAIPYYYRTPGYSIIILLTGFPFTRSVTGLIAVQSLMAIAIPVLSYWTLLPFGKKAGVVCAYVLIGTLSNTYFSTAIMTEQSYIFFMVLFLWFLSKLSQEPSSRIALFATICITAAVLIRGLAIPLLFVPFALLCFLPGNLRKIGAVYATGALLVTYGLIVLKNSYAEGLDRQERFSNVSQTNLEGRTLFSNVYLFSSVFNESVFLGNGVGIPLPKVAPSNGPATERLFALLSKDFSENHGQFPEYSNGAELVKDYQKHPSMRKWGYISFIMLDRQIGVIAADRLLMDSSKEAIFKHPELALTWFTNGLLYLTGPPYIMQIAVQPVFYIPRLYIYFQATESAKDKHALKAMAPQVIDAFAEIWGILFLVVKPLLLFFVILNARVMFSGPGRVFAGIVLGIFMYHVAATSVFSAPAERYVFTTFPLVVMLFAIAVGTKPGSSSYGPDRPAPKAAAPPRPESQPSSRLESTSFPCVITTPFLKEDAGVRGRGE